LGLIGQMSRDKLLVIAVHLQELAVSASLDDAARPHDYDLIGVSYRAQPMSDHNYRLPSLLDQRIERLLNLML